MLPGDRVLRVRVRDRRAKEGYSFTAQVLDFEVLATQLMIKKIRPGGRIFLYPWFENKASISWAGQRFLS